MRALVTLEALLEGRWQKAGVLEFPDEGAGDRGQCFFDYDSEYLDAWLDAGRSDAAASLRFPLEWGPSISPTWPSFLDDVRPMGSARRWWLSRLGLTDAPSSELPALLRRLGLPQETLEFPGLGLLRTEERLRTWGLL